MKATARRVQGADSHEVQIRSFSFPAGAPTRAGGVDGTPTPQELLAASLAACSTLAMETYAQRKGWDIGDVAVEVDYEAAQQGHPARCGVVVSLPDHVPEERRRRLMCVAAKSPVHRTLEGETIFDERLELSLPDPAGNGQSAGTSRRGNRLLRRMWPSSRRVAREAAGSPRPRTPS